jgi:predicted secreted protein
MSNIMRLILLSSFIFLIFCISSDRDNRVVYKFDSEEEDTWDLKVKNGTKIVLKIQGNPTTGYNWYIKNRNMIDKNLLQTVNLDADNSVKFENPDVPFGFVGAPGYFPFKFDVLNPGKVSIRFMYKRPWEREALRNVVANVEIVE